MMDNSINWDINEPIKETNKEKFEAEMMLYEYEVFLNMKPVEPKAEMPDQNDALTLEEGD